MDNQATRAVLFAFYTPDTPPRQNLCIHPQGLCRRAAKYVSEAQGCRSKSLGDSPSTVTGGVGAEQLWRIGGACVVVPSPTFRGASEPEAQRRRLEAANLGK